MADIIQTGALDADTGFVVTGAAGDVNGDGYDDFIVSASSADFGGGQSGAYVVFGTASGFLASFSLSALNGTNGFRLDGTTDQQLGARSPRPMPATVTLNPFQGGFQAFQISGETTLGQSLGGGGDFNADGYDNLLFSVPGANGYAGSVCLVYGGPRITGGFWGQNDFVGSRGLRIDGPASGIDFGGRIGFAGDLNNDGADETMISAQGADGQAGRVYIIWGDAPPVLISFTGDGTNETIDGDVLNDTLAGMGGNDVLNGLDGDDLLDGGDMSDLRAPFGGVRRHSFRIGTGRGLPFRRRHGELARAVPAAAGPASTRSAAATIPWVVRCSATAISAGVASASPVIQARSRPSCASAICRASRRGDQARGSAGSRASMASASRRTPRGEANGARGPVMTRRPSARFSQMWAVRKTMGWASPPAPQAEARVSKNQPMLSNSSSSLSL